MKLNQYLQSELYSQHLVGIISDCVCGKSSTLMHNMCTLQNLDQIHYCIYFALDFVDEVVITEQYGNEVGLAALEWLDIHTTDDPPKEWLTNVMALILDKWTSPWLSSCGCRSSVLPMFESMWWQDRCSCRLSFQRLASCGGRTMSSQRLSPCGGRTSNLESSNHSNDIRLITFAQGTVIAAWSMESRLDTKWS